MEGKNISPEAFLAQWEQGNLADALVLDVRELGEWHYYHLENTLHMPMYTIPSKIKELPKDCSIYVICAHGIRSANVCGYMQSQGFQNLTNVEGGMAAVAELRGFAYD
ncbi:rhodanese-like domain-containing protein [Gorillibacterium massiliense]|uniref:rhodanese-like domain-containing protein n=1 Tax=Gorillibacterium massiliense TaxID=1280390 RepID=UPI0004B5103D|nr:rhodanese-like domain-containing protein [Gorillibacterium massiliense]